MKLEEVRESKEDLSFFLQKEVSFKDFSIDRKLFKLPPLALTKYERVNGLARFHFDKLDKPIEFKADERRTPTQHLYIALCLAHTYSRLNSFN